MTGLEDVSASENVVIWSLETERSVCRVSVPPQVAVVKLCYPDFLACGHLDGIITICHFEKNTNKKAYAFRCTLQSSIILTQKISFRGHVSAVISLDISKVKLFNSQ